jgi:hypothetical protein
MSNREERERLRQERLAAQSAAGSSERRRLIAGYVVAGILTLAVLGGLVAVILGGDDSGRSFDGCSEAAIEPDSGGNFNSLDPDCRQGTAPPALEQGDLALAAKAAGCQLREDLPDEGATHVDNQTEVTYETNPPTSGNHNPTWVADGAYLTPLRTNPQAAGNDLNIRNFVHAMEHGRVEIQYSSKLPEDQQLLLKGVFDEDPAGMLMYPNDDMPVDVAVTAWRQLLTCPTFDPAVVDAIRNFRDIHRGQAPENIPIDL